jgi:hypothetical protein
MAEPVSCELSAGRWVTHVDMGLRCEYALAEDVRYNERSAAERVNGHLKDDFGGRYVRVRGHAKVFCHLMFGVLALSIEQLMRLLT